MSCIFSPPTKSLAKAKHCCWLWCCVFSKSSLLVCPHLIYSPAGIRPSPPPSNKYWFQVEFIQISVMICLIRQCNKASGSRAFGFLTVKLYFKQNYSLVFTNRYSNKELNIFCFPDFILLVSCLQTLFSY